MDAWIELWRTEIVQKLRAVRRRLKQGVSPVSAEQAAALRAEVPRVELEAERLQQLALEVAFPATTTGMPDEIESVIRANPDTCLAAAEAPARAIAVLTVEFADFRSNQHR